VCVGRKVGRKMEEYRRKKVKMEVGM